VDSADSLTIPAGRTLTIAANGTTFATSRVSSVSITGGKLDLNDNDLIVTGMTRAAVEALVASGRHNGDWLGNGITSTSAANNAGRTSLGVVQASDLGATYFSGQTVSPSDVLVKYTYGGDANLDGKINVDDYGRIDSSVGLGLSGWFNGDFNYDGKINVDDYGIIDSNIGIQGGPLAAALAASPSTAVPEPAGTGILLLIAGSAGCLRRRRFFR
jgi:hypothetical protein